jgi:hypothetical protein
MGRAGRAAVKRLFDIEKLNDRLVEIYTTLLRSGAYKHGAMDEWQKDFRLQHHHNYPAKPGVC